MTSEPERRECERCHGLYVPLDDAQRYCRKQCARAASQARTGRKSPAARARDRQWWKTRDAPSAPARIEACERKTAYRSPSDARRAAIRIRSRSGPPLDPYKCPFCPAWHLTSSERAAS